MNRRALLKAMPAVLVAGAMPAVAVAVTVDPMVGLADAYVAAFNEWEAESAKDDGGNFDTPRHLELDEIKEVLAEKMEATPISSAACFAAFCRYVHVDNFIGDEIEQFPDMRRWQWKKIMEWSKATTA